MKSFLFFTLFLAFVSCGPAPELKHRSAIFFTNDKLNDGRINLDSKAPQEVYQIKYNNTVSLNCDFRALPEANLVLTDAKAESFSWNLVGTTEQSKTITYALGERILEVEVSAKMVMYSSFNTLPVDGVSYQLLHTPVVEITVRPIESNLPGEALAPLTVLEQMPAVSVTNIFGEEISKELRCSVQTEINPQYADEWKKIVSTP